MRHSGFRRCCANVGKKLLKLLLQQGSFLLLTSVTCPLGLASHYNVNALTISENEGRHVLVEGKYSNYDYAYSVLIPTGLLGCRDAAPSPNHGFGINLTEKSCGWMDRANDDVYPASYLYVDANYNSSEWKSPDEAIKAQIDLLKRKGAANISLTQRESMKLSRLSAVRVVLKYKISGKGVIEEMVISFRKEKAAPIVYTIGLTTPAERYDVDRRVLAKMLQTWELQSLP